MEPDRPPPLPVTWTLIAVNVLLFALEWWWGRVSTMSLYRMGANLGRDALGSEPWRLLSSAFLHGGPLHLLLNMWALWVFGTALERLFGPARFLTLYGASALGGGLLSAVIRAEGLAVGASERSGG